MPTKKIPPATNLIVAEKKYNYPDLYFIE